MTLIEYPKMEQRSESWFEARRGIVTASVVGKLIATETADPLEFDCSECKASEGLPCVSLRGGKQMKTIHFQRQKVAGSQDARLVVADGEVARGIVATLAAERVAGFNEETPMTRDMFRGVWSEPFARDLYSTHYEQAVDGGFMVRQEDGWSLGYSPDGLVGTDGLIEIKSPRSKTQLLTVVGDQMPAHYMAQCQAGLLVSGRKWLDFVSYVGGMHIYVKRVLPDPEWFTAIEAACRAFETKASALVDDYLTRVEGRPVAPRIDFLAETEFSA